VQQAFVQIRRALQILGSGKTDAKAKREVLMVVRTLLGLMALALGFVSLVLMGLWGRSQQSATLDSGISERLYPSRSINVVVPFPAGGPCQARFEVDTPKINGTVSEDDIRGHDWFATLHREV
jgi:hypothetical protein